MWDEADQARHVDYIHYNPVKHGWVKQVRDWPYSTFHRYVRMGVYAKEWAGVIGDQGAAMANDDPRIPLRCIRATWGAGGLV